MEPMYQQERSREKILESTKLQTNCTKTSFLNQNPSPKTKRSPTSAFTTRNQENSRKFQCPAELKLASAIQLLQLLQAKKLQNQIDISIDDWNASPTQSILPVKTCAHNSSEVRLVSAFVEQHVYYLGRLAIGQVARKILQLHLVILDNLFTLALHERLPSTVAVG
ncbi:Hypothetical_protein [Hexamita inflata]|uniref:Hypothetical_protein n=1 Tax=Hexamita inflata TaxID=28002 RepID=A0AA86N917_9EUKA|nr:Hypothetical protein HINF_LOCUS2269 [Hexamita inflata]